MTFVYFSQSTPPPTTSNDPRIGIILVVGVMLITGFIWLMGKIDYTQPDRRLSSDNQVTSHGLKITHKKTKDELEEPKPSKCTDIGELTRIAVSELPKDVTMDWINTHERKLKLLQDKNGIWYGIDLYAQENMRICGMSGSGKGNVQQLLAFQALSLGPAKCHVWFLDSKSGMDYRTFATRITHARLFADEYLLNDVFEPCLDSAGKPISLYDGTLQDGLIQLTREMNRRNRIIGDAGWVNIVEYNNHIQEQNRLPILIAIIDEAASLNNEQKLLEQDIARKCRSAGIILVVATQYPTVEAIPSQVQPNLHRGLTLKVDSNKYSAVALGVVSGTKYPYEPAALGEAGVGIWRQSGGEFVVGRVPEMKPDVRQKMIDRLVTTYPRAPIRDSGITNQYMMVNSTQTNQEAIHSDEPNRSRSHVTTDWTDRDQRLALWLFAQLMAGRKMTPSDLSGREIGRFLYPNTDGGGGYAVLTDNAIRKVFPTVEQWLLSVNNPTNQVENTH